MYIISVFKGVVEEERCILRNKKYTAIYLHLKARVCHDVLLVKDERVNLRAFGNLICSELS